MFKKFFLLISNFKLKTIVKFLFRRSPYLLFFLKQNFYFVLPGILDKKQFYLYSGFDNMVGKNFFLLNGNIFMPLIKTLINHQQLFIKKMTNIQNVYLIV